MNKIDPVELGKLVGSEYRKLPDHPTQEEIQSIRDKARLAIIAVREEIDVVRVVPEENDPNLGTFNDA